jgi:hypothetical protein
MKLEGIKTQRLLTLVLTEREVRVLCVALSVAEVSSDALANARNRGVHELKDDDLTDLYGGLTEVLREADAPVRAP